MSIQQKKALLVCDMAILKLTQRDLASMYGISEGAMSQRLNPATKYGKKYIPLILRDVQNLMAKHMMQVIPQSEKDQWAKRPVGRSLPSIDWTNIVAWVVFLGVVLMSILHVAGVFIPLQ